MKKKRPRSIRVGTKFRSQHFSNIAAARIRNDGWRDGEQLRQDLVEYIKPEEEINVAFCLDKYQ